MDVNYKHVHYTVYVRIRSASFTAKWIECEFLYEPTWYHVLLDIKTSKIT
jgi:hypothetical protein